MVAKLGGPITAEARRQRARIAGRRAENWAALYLRLKGYRILARGYCVRGGEIDLVVRRGSNIVFVEVKYRPTLIAAMNAIDTWKRQRVSRAARVWLSANPWAAALTLRGDAVYLAPRQWPRHAIAAVALDFD
ncbi:MAG: YraN family protein [Methylovirgula sp.]|uniref:YraN family protein n=1 Tax=Methylovirgula sp. TaxID=1978224 RepID=UPI0030766720